MNLGLGIDTGGTYTDAVILDFDSGRVLRKAKALTTRHDLTIGIANSIEGLSEIQTEEIKLVSVSTTLATNAAVEGRGGRVCLLAIGYYPKILKESGIAGSYIKSVHLIGGGHDIMGDELAPLDVVEAERVIAETKNTVDAYAVSAYGGVRNPAHELQLRDVILRRTDRPVVCGHQLTSQLDSIKRAATAALNARLMPLISDLVKAMQRVLADKGISAPLMIVKGDGHIMNTRVSMERPVETLLSGPAASIVGGRYLSGVADGVIIDMGGTTTDIAVLRAGEPAVIQDGASVGGWRTCVRAADIRTAGIGGDSHVLLDENGITLNPKRVIPLSLAAAFHHQILDELKILEALRRTSILVPPCDCFIKLRNADGIPLNSKERDVLAALNDGPKSLIKLADEVNALHPTLLGTDSLEEAGLVGRIGLTPTDILHAQGVYTQWNIEAAERGVQLYARQLGQGIETVIDDVLAAVNKKVAVEVLSKFISDDTSLPSILGCDVCQLLVDNALGGTKAKNNSLAPSPLIPLPTPGPSQEGRMGRGLWGIEGCDKGEDISINIRVNMPLVAIGAPVEAYFPKVASMLSTELIIPEHAEVANAVGAITGTIVETVEVTLTPVYAPFGIDHFTVHTPIDKRDFRELKEAVAYSKQVAEQLAVQKATHAGAEEVEVELNIIDHKGVVAQGHGDNVFLGSIVRATAAGKSINR
ncbi:hydantoinase/oxoprolinase family protein [Candidatus Poribacteria bacterium]|nr:hydantoinase/oxoprolinase family protein [Candidatus Poribacteria bacterium]